MKGFFHFNFGVNLPNEISPRENLSRFLISKKQFSKTKNLVKPSAFLPPKNLHLSVFRTENLPNKTIWEIGLHKVVNRMNPPRTFYARADFLAAIAISLQLQIVSDNKPIRHANIVGWPEEKSKRKEITLEIAADSNLKLNPLKYQTNQ